MDVQTWTYIIVGITFLIYISIAIWSRTSSTSEFYVAGKGVSPLANGMATAADWMSAASFISMAGIIAFAWYDGSVYLMGWTGGYVLLALLVAPYLRNFGKFTVPDFICDSIFQSIIQTSLSFKTYSSLPFRTTFTPFKASDSAHALPKPLLEATVVSPKSAELPSVEIVMY